MIDKVLIGRPFIAHQLRTIPPVEKESDFFNLLEKFFAFSLPKVYSAKTLAMELAKRTRFLRDEVVAEELLEEETGKGFILGFYEAFKEYLKIYESSCCNVPLGGFLFYSYQVAFKRLLLMDVIANECEAIPGPDLACKG